MAPQLISVCPGCRERDKHIAKQNQQIIVMQQLNFSLSMEKIEMEKLNNSLLNANANNASLLSRAVDTVQHFNDAKKEIQRLESMMTQLHSQRTKNLQLMSHPNPTSLPPSSLTQSQPPKKKKSKNKARKQRRYENPHNVMTYDPPYGDSPVGALPFRAEGNSFISHRMTEEIIPTCIREKLLNLYGYMHRSMTLSMSHSEIKMDQTKLIDYDFHDKDDIKESLYCVIAPPSEWSRSRGYKWEKVGPVIYFGPNRGAI